MVALRHLNALARRLPIRPFVLTLFLLVAGLTGWGLAIQAPGPLVGWQSWLHEFGHVLAALPQSALHHTLPGMTLESNGDGLTTLPLGQSPALAVFIAWAGQGLAPWLMLGLVAVVVRGRTATVQGLLMGVGLLTMGSALLLAPEHTWPSFALETALVPLGCAGVVRLRQGRTAVLLMLSLVFLSIANDLWSLTDEAGAFDDLQDILHVLPGTATFWVSTWVVSAALGLVGVGRALVLQVRADRAHLEEPALVPVPRVPATLVAAG